MDDILENLGVEVATEKSLERLVFRDKVLNNMKFPMNGLVIPTVDGAPRLTSHSINKLLKYVGKC